MCCYRRKYREKIVDRKMIYNLMARLNESGNEPSEGQALKSYLEEMKATNNTSFAIDTTNGNVLDKVFIMHEVHHQFFIRYHQHLGIDSTHNVNRLVTLHLGTQVQLKSVTIIQFNSID